MRGNVILSISHARGERFVAAKQPNSMSTIQFSESQDSEFIDPTWPPRLYCHSESSLKRSRVRPLRQILQNRCVGGVSSFQGGPVLNCVKNICGRSLLVEGDRVKMITLWLVVGRVLPSLVARLDSFFPASER